MQGPPALEPSCLHALLLLTLSVTLTGQVEWHRATQPGEEEEVDSGSEPAAPSSRLNSRTTPPAAIGLLINILRVDHLDQIMLAKEVSR